MQTTSTEDSNSTRYHMLHDPVHKLVIKMAIPTTISQIISVIYNTADTYFVAHLGKSAAAAVGVGFSLMSIIQAIGFGIGMGAGSLISRELGAGDEKKANMHASSAFAMVLCASILLDIFGNLGIRELMTFLGSSDTMLPYACDYARYILLGCPIMCTSFVLNNILRSEGSARYAMIGITTGGVLNVILDPIFIYTFNMGIKGAAIATILSQFISFLILASSFISKRSSVRIRPDLISRSANDYLTILRTGSPTFCRQGLASFASAMLNIRARIYGDAAVAAITIATKIYLLVRNIVMGIGQGYQPVAGFNFGSGNYKRTREAYTFSCVIGTVLCLFFGALSFFFAPEIIAWFQNDPEVVSMGTTALRLACCAMPFLAYSTYTGQLFQCLGFSKTAIFIACSRQGSMFLPAILILPALFKLSGVMAAQPAADILSFFLCIPFQVIFFKKVLTKS